MGDKQNGGLRLPEIPKPRGGFNAWGLRDSKEVPGRLSVRRAYQEEPKARKRAATRLCWVRPLQRACNFGLAP